MRTWFAAQWPGQCGSCGNYFRAGDSVYYDEDSELNCCEPLPRSPKQKPCQQCFQIPSKSGVCCQ